MDIHLPKDLDRLLYDASSTRPYISMFSPVPKYIQRLWFERNKRQTV